VHSSFLTLFFSIPLRLLRLLYKITNAATALPLCEISVATIVLMLTAQDTQPHGTFDAIEAPEGALQQQVFERPEREKQTALSS
jgi:hypothetical protein